MNEKIISDFSQWLSAKYIFLSEHEIDCFVFEYFEFNFVLEVYENDNKFRVVLRMLNKPNNISDFNIHLDNYGRDEMPTACLGLDRFAYFSFDEVIIRVADWVFNAWEVYSGNKIPDHGFRHGNAAFFEEYCSRFGYVPSIRTLNNLDDCQVEEIIKIAKETYADLDISKECLIESIRKGLSNA